MAEQRRGMGRGLAAILSVSEAPATEDELREVPVELISPNPNQPRRRFDDETLAGLAGPVFELAYRPAPLCC